MISSMDLRRHGGMNVLFAFRERRGTLYMRYRGWDALSVDSLSGIPEGDDLISLLGKSSNYLNVSHSILILNKQFMDYLLIGNCERWGHVLLPIMKRVRGGAFKTNRECVLYSFLGN